MAGSSSASMERAAAGRSTAIRARPKTSRSRSSSRGPQRPRSPPAELALEVLERREEVEGAGRRVRTGRRVERHDRVAELGLVVDADRLRSRTGATRHGARLPGSAARAREPPRRAWPRHRRRWRRGRCTRGRDGRSRVPRRWRLDSGPCARSAVRIMHPEPGPDAGTAGALAGRGARAVARRHANGLCGGRRERRRDRQRGRPTRCPSARVFADIVPSGRGAGSSSSGRGRSRWRRPPTGATSWPPPGPTDRLALANNRYSADVVAIARHRELLADLRTCPATTRCRAGSTEVAGYRVDDLRRRWRLGDRHRRPAGRRAPPAAAGCGRRSISATRRRPNWRRSGPSPRDARAELARRRSHVRGDARVARAARPLPAIRAWVEERGPAGSVTAGDGSAKARPGRSAPSASSGSSSTGRACALGDLLARLCDAAIVDTRVLLAHRLGADEAGWPRRRGSLRLGPAAARAGRRSMAPGADGVRGGGADPDPAGRAHPGRSGRAAGHRAARRAGTAMDVTPGLRRDPVPGPRRGRRGRGARGPDPRRDRARRPDHLRPVHGARAVRPGWRLLPGRSRSPGPRRGLPDRAGGAPDLRGRAVARRRRRLGSAGPAGSVRAPRARRRDRARSRSRSSTASPRAPGPAGVIRYEPIEVEPRRLEAIAAGSRRPVTVRA